jgi:hypothetical protein
MSNLIKRIAQSVRMADKNGNLEQELLDLEKKIRDRESQYYSAQEAIADGPLIQSLQKKANELRQELQTQGWQRPMGNSKFEALKEFVAKYVDDQVGEGVLDVEVTPDYISFIDKSGYGLVDGGQDMAEELQDILDRDSYGKYSIAKVGEKGFSLNRSIG